MIACLTGLVLTLAAADTFVVQVVSPKGRSSKTPISEFLRAARTELEKRTRLDVESLEQAGIDAEELSRCPREERLACWTRTLDLGPRTPAFLLVLAVHPTTDTEDELLAILLDVAEARRRAAAGSGDKDAIEDAINTNAVASKPATAIQTGEAAELDAYFAALFDRDLRAKLERTWGPRAQVTAPIELAPIGPKRTSPAWTGTIIGGGAVAAIGAVITAIAIAKSADGLWYGCISRPGDDITACPEVAGPTFAHDPSAAPSTDYASVNPPGLHVLPLGVSLLAAGGTTALLTWLVADEAEIPLYELAAGIFAFGAAYGVAQVIDAP